MKTVNCKLKIFKFNAYLFIIILIGAFLRLYGLNWDQGFHLHPDERAITLYTLPISFPNNFWQFFTQDSPLNPHFFAYGSFPIYLLKILGSIFGIINPYFNEYSHINILGRFFSSIFDLLTVILIYKFGKKIFNEKIGLMSAFFYTVSVLAIQSSHFYIADIPLTFFILLTLYYLVTFYEKPSIKKAFLIGIFFGLSLATKTSASLLVISIGITLLVDFILIFLRSPHKIRIWFPHIPQTFKHLFTYGSIIFITTIFIFLLSEPYALIDFQNFWRQTLEQRQMTYNAFTFPYTLQYVGKTPYFYEAKNIFLWGQGPILSLFSFLGAIYFTYLSLKQLKREKLIIAIFFWTYFLVVGSFAIGFMRYLLPIYPLLSLFAATFFYHVIQLFKPKLRLFLVFCFLFLVLLWPLSFLSIYTQPNTRVLTSTWIINNIPSGKTLAIEHWDDGLPLFGQENYNILTLPLYNFDNAQKWDEINQKLSQTDYIIIASNRLYTPLQKLTDCSNLPSHYCYKKTAEYYKNLFNGSLGFKKVAEFNSYPKLEIGPPTGGWKLEIRDEIADESFTVYDHPKIMIFKNEKKN